jgi:hypothetical protein
MRRSSHNTMESSGRNNPTMRTWNTTMAETATVATARVTACHHIMEIATGVAAASTAFAIVVVVLHL